jgi:nitroreductase
MNFLELARARRSVRAYTDDPIEAHELDAVLEAARAAPSAGNLQAVEILVVRDAAVKEALAAAALGQRFVAEAPVVLVFFRDPARSGARYGTRGREFYAVQDATIACAYAQLAAVDAGLATCWVGAYDDDRVSDALDAPPDLEPIAILPLGRPAESPPPAGRRALAEMVHDERFWHGAHRGKSTAAAGQTRSGDVECRVPETP